MPIDFYMAGPSPPCRAVALTAKALGVELNNKVTNIIAGETKTPEFLKMNPQHTVPTIDDNGFYLWESRAIMLYLFNKYAKDDSLYPKDPQKRAKVDKSLFQETSSVMPAWGGFVRPLIFEKAAPNPEALQKFKSTLEPIEAQLSNQNYLTGNQLTLADLALVSTLSTTEVFNVDLSSFPNISAWMNRMKALPYYKEANQDGIDQFRELLKNR